MARNNVISLVLTFFIIFSSFNIIPYISSSETSVTLAGSILYVGPSSTFMTIQSAVDFASDGDTIIVENSTYTESVYIYTSNLTIIGNSSSKCIINYNYNSTSWTTDY
ncbi:MAG: hypothetical protein FK734_14585, partial [Asgard group archaeon]|nr:hypothetical protein [Asgard group archaeon]